MSRLSPIRVASRTATARAIRSTATCAVVFLVAGGVAVSARAAPVHERGSGSGTRAASARASACPKEQRAAPRGPAAEAQSLGTVNGHEIEAAVYPRPSYEGGPWSQWGQGIVLADGRFISAIGDHRGRDGNSYLFVYDPAQRRILRFTDVLSHVDHVAGEWGYGKIHAQMVVGPCGDVFVATYWGTDADLRYGQSYKGDLLFRLDTRTFNLQPLGVPLAKHGISTLAGFSTNGLLYGQAPVPTPADATGSVTGAFFAYDPSDRKVVFSADDNRLTGFRNVLVDRNGVAHLAAQNSRLLRYTPGAKELTLDSERLPGGFLRASTVPARDGTTYGATQDPNRLFAFRADGHIDDLGAARGYTASVALDPDGQRFFYVPGAQGDSWEQGTPLVAVDTKTGEQTTVAQLNALAEQKLGLTLNGSYDVSVDRTGSIVYIGMNAGRDRQDPWGEVVLIIVHLK